MRKPNYNMERKDRDRAKQAKATAKLEKRAAKSNEGGESETSAAPGQIDSSGAEREKADK